MRITKIEIEGFRAYNDREVFDCSGDAVILVGPNGYGKTSFFDALAWCFFGEIRRLRGNRDAVGEDYVANRFAEGVEPRVTIHLSRGTRTVSITRRPDRVSVIDDGTEYQDDSATQWIASLISGANLPKGTSLDDAERVFNRCYLLGQDQMASFLQTRPRERFDALSSLLGVDLVRHFYTHEEGVAESLDAELEEGEAELLRLNNSIESVRVEREQLETPTPRGRVGLSRMKATLEDIRAAATKDLGMTLVPSRIDSPADVLEEADDLVARLRGAQQTLSTRIDESRRLHKSWAELPQISTRLHQIEHEQAETRAALTLKAEEVAAAGRELKAIRGELTTTESAISRLEREKDEFNRFLVLAQSHITGDSCPVCEQGINPQRLLRGIDERVQELPSELRRLSRDLARITRREADALGRLAEAETAAAALQARTDSTDAQIHELVRKREDLRRRALALSPELERTVDAQRFSVFKTSLESELARLQLLLRRAEQLVMESQYLSSRNRVRELTREQGRLEEKRSELEGLRNRIKSAHSIASDVVRRAKEGEQELVSELLDAQQPLLDALYQRLRPHPVLDHLRIEYGQFAHRGEVYFLATSGSRTANVATLFSSAQLNAVAACIFLSLNLSQRGSQLELVSLDDPIQNMDDYNVLGLLDLLRGFIPSRQVFIATHDLELSELIRRKLRPRTQGARAIVHRFTSFGVEGPVVESEIDEYRPEPYLLTQVAG